MAQQTAVEWLATYLKGITTLNCDDIIEQAKELEKEQLVDAYWEGRVSLSRAQPMSITEFYHKTYGSRDNKKTKKKK